MNKVLVTWVAKNNDPFESDAKGVLKRDEKDKNILGPTLSLLFNPESFLCNQVSDVVLLCRKFTKEDRSDHNVADEISKELKKYSKVLKTHILEWTSSDPTDHQRLFDFLNNDLTKKLRRLKFDTKELVVHISPGTPAMHAVMLLMAECGYFGRRVTVVKSYRKGEKTEKERFVLVNLGLNDFFHNYETTRPADSDSSTIDVVKYASPAMKELYEAAKRHARISSHILVYGEAGTDKYALASWIRNNSGYRKTENDASWPRLNCAEVYDPGQMYKRLHGPDGLLEKVSGETVLLENLHQLDERSQLMIASVLESRDFKIIAISNQEPDELKAKLHPDLFAYFEIVVLRVPPLREIKADIPVFWEHTVKALLNSSALQSHERNNISSFLLHHWRVDICDRLAHQDLPGNQHDLKKLACALVEAILASSTILSDTIVNKIVSETYSLSISPQCSVPQAITRAFSCQSSLDEILDTAIPLNLDQLFKELKAFIADQFQHYASTHPVSLSQMSDHSERTIRSWQKNANS